MRPLRLCLTAFGPYLKTQVVDLRGFRNSRLFLIHGPVGSGKTFLLDGICCALYGRSSGGERDRRGMRNLSAGPETDTVVVLDFEVASESYRIERRFALDSHGEFLPDDVTLWRLPSFAEPARRDIVSSSLSGVEGMLARLLGLSVEQFCQVAILPQGQFRRFLHAAPQERTAIIGRMFDGELYLRLTALLQQEHEELKQQLSQVWKEREDVLERYKETSGDPRETVWRSQEELSAITDACQGHQHKSVEWERGLESAVRYETLERQREMSQRELEELTLQGEAPADGLTRRLKAALPDFFRWRDATEEIAAIVSELDEQRAQYEKLKRETNFLEAEVEAARLQEEEKYALLRAQERLQEVAQEAAGLSCLEGELDAARGRLCELAKSRATLSADVKRAKARAEKLRSGLARVEGVEQRLLALRHDIAGMETKEQQARQKAQLLAAVEQARQREGRLKETLKGLQEELQLVCERLAAQRAQSRLEALHLLHAELLAGSPCPLCGSREHPHPFEDKQQRRPIDEELEQRIAHCKARCDHAQQELAQAEQRRARLEGRLEAMAEVGEQEGLGELLESLRATVVTIEGRLADQRAHQEELERIDAELLPRRKTLRRMRLQKERLEATMEGAVKLYTERRERLEELCKVSLGEAAVLEAGGWEQPLASEKERIAARLSELEAVVYGSERVELMAETFALGLAERRAAEQRRQQLQRQTADLEAMLLERFRLDFANWSDLAFALGREAREFRLSEESVIDKETLVLAVRRQLDQTQELLSTVPAPPMRSEQLRHALTREREQLELKMARKATLQRAVEEGNRDIELYDTLVEKIRALETQQREVAPLAAAVAGDNPSRVSFYDWVLQRFFSQILGAANRKLEILAPQRFVLLQEQGLEVSVLDLQAGTARSAKTLSGGESFLASLALALGLGDVLQGREKIEEKLSTLFIDEGFGYLDQQALDAALHCLENLRGEGRTIGIVSHVESLRERIRAQIVVAPGDEAGSGGRIQVFSV